MSQGKWNDELRADMMRRGQIVEPPEPDPVPEATADPDRVPYRPSNATEGDGFMSVWCANCREFFGDGEETASCQILADTMALQVDDEAYPPEWRKDGPAGPRCTAFREGDEPGPLDPAAVIHPLL